MIRFTGERGQKKQEREPQRSRTRTPHDHARQSLLVVLINYEPKPVAGCPPLVIGLSDVVREQSQTLLQALKQSDTLHQRRVLVHDLCAALHELHEAL